MLAIIRAYFPTMNPANVWTDAQMQSWLDPSIPYSLAHYFSRTSFFQADLSYHLFPILACADPRMDTSLPGDTRNRLITGVLREADLAFQPDWDSFSQYLMWFPEPIEMCGGGWRALPARAGIKCTGMTGSVFNLMCPFDGICQEVGHGYGLQHELSPSGIEYGSPYSAMSSSGQGSSWERPKEPRLPTGVMLPVWLGVSTDDPFRITGPYIPPVHFYLGNYPWFADPETTYIVPQSYETTPESFYLMAVDKGISDYPYRRRVLAVLPPIAPNTDRFFVEVRRSKDYDQGISAVGTGSAPAGIVISSHSPKTNRITYVDHIPFAGGLGDRDYYSLKGRFRLRIDQISEDFSGASLRVSGSGSLPTFGISFGQPVETFEERRVTEWAAVEKTPCSMFAPREYTCRYHYGTSQVVLEAVTHGFEKPHYRWFVNDQEIGPAPATLKLDLPVQAAHDGAFQKPHNRAIQIAASILGDNQLQLRSSDSYSGIHASVRVIASESAPDVNTADYPDQEAWTGIDLNNVQLEWDANYIRDMVMCVEGYENLRIRIGEDIPTGPADPEPGFTDLEIRDLQTELRRRDPTIADSIFDLASELTKINYKDRLKEI